MINVKEITKLIGIPFEKCNCWELARKIYKIHGIELPNWNISCDAVKSISKVYKEQMNLKEKWLELKTYEPLAIMPMIESIKYPTHCGIYLLDGLFAQSLEETGVVLSNINDPLFKNKILGYYRYIG